MTLIKLWEADIEKAYALQNAFEQDENGFINAAYGLSFEEFAEYVHTGKNYSLGIGLPEGFVPASVYLLADGEEYVGIFNLRHRLNEALKNGAGHIGYGIAPTHRGKGYATAGLRLLIEEAKTIVADEELYLSAKKYNSASLKVQLKNGAYVHHEDEHSYYTRIPKR